MNDNDNAAIILNERANKAKKPLITKRQLKELGKGAAIGAVIGLSVVGLAATVLLYADKLVIKE
jgi:hypothetical protein